jgi:hypothetical protein
MFGIQEFFKYYQTNFFKYQQIINNNALENIDYWVSEFDDESRSNNKNEITQIIKSHIRITYLHCIDTLFELIFGLYPRDGIIDDKNLPLIISKSNDKFNKPKIDGLAKKTPNIIEELNQEIHFGKNTTTLLQYIFYYQVNRDNSDCENCLEEIENSLEPIKELLSIFAKDLADKSEYNSLKHALRVFPHSSFLKVSSADNEKQILNLDFKNAQQFILETKQGIKIVTKKFNAKRDFEYTLIASSMIWNIIKLRDKFINRTNEEDPLHIYFYEHEMYKDIETENIGLKTSLTFTMNKNE